MSYLLVLALVSLGVPLALSLSRRVDTEVRSQARSQADVVAISASAAIAPPELDDLNRLAHTAGAAIGGRIVIVDRVGRALADSAGSASLGLGYESRPEVAAALSGRRVQDRRRSRTLDAELLVTAVPVVRNGRPVGAVRVTQSVEAVRKAVRSNVLGLVGLGVSVLVLGFVVALVLARQLSGPMVRLRAAAQRVAEGDLTTTARVEGPAEQRELARAFNAMTARVARALAAQESFVADASHQLRTPLTGVRLRIEEARAGRLPEAAERHLRAATGELDRMAHVIDELLLLSRTGERDAPGEPLELVGVADAACGRWTAAAAERGQSLTLEARVDSAEVWCARSDLDRALDAVIENALRYSPDGSAVTVRVTAGAIEVLDQGPGLSDADSEAVFERFRRGEAARGGGVPGTGLGLTIALEMMRRWGGEATLENAPGGGARARLSLPLFTGSLPAGA